jgi:hypothetical protein
MGPTLVVVVERRSAVWERACLPGRDAPRVAVRPLRLEDEQPVTHIGPGTEDVVVAAAPNIPHTSDGLRAAEHNALS